MILYIYDCCKSPRLQWEYLTKSRSRTKSAGDVTPTVGTSIPILYTLYPILYTEKSWISRAQHATGSGLRKAGIMKKAVEAGRQKSKRRDPVEDFTFCQFDSGLDWAF